MNPNKLLRVQESEAARKESSEMSQRSGVQRYLVAVEYIGTNFVGMQKQPNCRTVQGVLEDAFSKFIGQPVSSANSSRTVRLLVGVLKCAGTGTITVDDVERILEARTITKTPPMAPACGLYLAEVKYDFSSSIVTQMEEDEE